MTPQARGECAVICDALLAIGPQLYDVSDRAFLARERFGDELAVVTGAVETAGTAFMRALTLAMTVPRG